MMYMMKLAGVLLVFAATSMALVIDGKKISIDDAIIKAGSNGSMREVPLTTPKPCVDIDPRCREWSEAGQCEGSSEYIERTCPNSCGFCRPPGDQDPENICVDNDSECWTYKSSFGNCEGKDQTYLKNNCKFTCGYCPFAECTDLSDNCLNWKAYCSVPSFKDYLSKNCAATCGLCTTSVEDISRSPTSTTVPEVTTSCYDLRGSGPCGRSVKNCGMPFVSRMCRKTCGICEEDAFW